MAGGSEKKYAAARQKALIRWGSVALGINIIYFLLLVFIFDKSLLQWGHLLLLASYGVSVYMIVQTAQPEDEKPKGFGRSQSAFDKDLEGSGATGGHEIFYDMFYITAATQLVLLFTGWAWLLFCTIPGFAIYKSWSFLADKYRQFKQMARVAQGLPPEEEAAEQAGRGPNVKAQEKKKRQQEQKMAQAKGVRAR